MFEEDILIDFHRISNLFVRHTLFEQKRMMMMLMEVEFPLVLKVVINNKSRQQKIVEEI